MNNGKYNKIKLLHELCRISWFLDKYAIKESKCPDCKKTFKVLKKDIDKHLATLEEAMDEC